MGLFSLLLEWGHFFVDIFMHGGWAGDCRRAREEREMIIKHARETYPTPPTTSFIYMSLRLTVMKTLGNHHYLLQFIWLPAKDNIQWLLRWLNPLSSPPALNRPVWSQICHISFVKGGSLRTQCSNVFLLLQHCKNHVLTQYFCLVS